jgi:hypothetical protein
MDVLRAPSVTAITAACANVLELPPFVGYVVPVSGPFSSPIAGADVPGLVRW